MATGGLLATALRALRLPATERRRAIEAVAELTRASVELRVRPSRGTVARLGTLQHTDPEGGVGAATLREAALVGDIVARAAGRLPWRPTCLRQALAVQRMLRRRGIPAQLHLGVTSPTEAEAHAWVTVAGEAVVGGAGVERYVPLAAFS